jgi:hypothetical protein
MSEYVNLPEAQADVDGLDQEGIGGRYAFGSPVGSTAVLFAIGFGLSVDQ